MNRFAIFHLLALFCISFATAQADLEEVCKLTKLFIFGGPDAAISIRGKGDVHLYRDGSPGTANYVIRNESRQFGEDLSIIPCNTVVFNEDITIRGTESVMVLTVDMDPFAFYQKMYPINLENYVHSFPASRTSVGGKTYCDVSFVKPITLGDGELIVVAEYDNKPRLIVPVSFVKSLSRSDHKVYLAFKSKIGMGVFIEFDTYEAAYMFELDVQPQIRK